MDMITMKNAMNAEEFTVHEHRLKHNAQAGAKRQNVLWSIVTVIRKPEIKTNCDDSWWFHLLIIYYILLVMRWHQGKSF